jgi:hypothetical protein
MRHKPTTIVLLWSLCAALAGAFPTTAFSQQGLAHGLWVWKTPSILAAPGSAEALRDFCRSQEINEVYISFSRAGVAPSAQGEEDSRLAQLIAVLHGSRIRVEALLSSADADQPGKYRDKLLDHVQEILEFNRQHPASRFDGIHLDIEPQQRPENKGPGNLAFLPGLVDAYEAVRTLAASARLTVDANIPNKFLKGDLGQRRMLLSALPRFTLMLYELSSPNDGESNAAKEEKLRQASQKFLSMAYEGLDDPHMGKLAIGLRSPDYEESTPNMLKVLDRTLDSNPHYLGWAWHSYNDAPQAAH